MFLKLSTLRFFIILILSFFISSVSFSQGNQSSFGVLKEIKIVGNKKIEKDAILNKVKLKIGAEIKRSEVSDCIKEIHKLGYFDDISFLVDQGVLTIEVKERPTITKIEFEGNEQVSESDLKDVIKLKEYAILDVNKAKEDVLAIQKHYEDKGYYLARVSYEVKKTDKPDEVHLVYKVSDYEKVRIKKITFINNKRFSDDKLKSLMRNTQEGNFFSWISSSGNFKESAFKQDLQMLTYFYLDNGYVKFHYETPIVTVSEDKKWLFISIFVDEGEQYRVGKVDFAGDLLFSEEELFNSVKLREGQVFSISKRNEDIQKLTEKYQDLGYAFVNVNPRMNINDEEKIVDIKYEFEKGNLAYFGEINIIGNTKTRDKVIRREMRIREGELYNGTRLRVSKERIERLGYFAPGEVVINTITRKDNKNIVDVEVSIKERSTGTITLGMGYGSVQKFFLTAQISEINLFGKGQSLSFGAQYSSNRYSRSFNISFTEPYTFDTRWSSGVDLYYVVFPIPGRYLQFRKGFNLRAGHPIFNDVTMLYSTYKFERLDLDFVRTDIDPDLDVTPDLGYLSSVTVSMVRDVRNNRFETTQGNYQSVSSEFAGTGVGGNKDFIKNIGEVRYYTPLTDNLVFRSKFEVGHIFQTTKRVIPPSERFYLGGPNNLKSFDMFSVSPRSARGTPLGGTTEFVAISEFEYPLIREAGLKWVMFLEAGNSYASWNEFSSFSEIKKGTGFGFRWFSPIGPLRFEWGFPINRRPDESDVVFNFFIGPPF